MRLDLDISRDEQMLLERQAAALGKDVAVFVAVDQWRAGLQAFAERHRPTGHPLDDSRESIYHDPD